MSMWLPILQQLLHNVLGGNLGSGNFGVGVGAILDQVARSVLDAQGKDLFAVLPWF